MRATTEERQGDWFVTFSGGQFWPYDPRPEDFQAVDIAHALSQVCRYAGHCRVFYSVAQHSVHVMRLVVAAGRPELAFAALMHDATEAYVGDVIRPIKRGHPIFREMEDRVWAALCARFGLDLKLDPAIKDADNVALLTERRDLCAPHWEARPWREDGQGYELDPAPIVAWTPGEAKARWLDEFERLCPMFRGAAV